MIRTVFSLFVISAAAGCATTPPPTFSYSNPEPVALSAPTPVATTAVAPIESPVSADATTTTDYALTPRFVMSEPTESHPESALLNPGPITQGGSDEDSDQYFSAKFGYYGSDIDEMDGGWILNLAWTRYFISLLALEVELGYFTDDGSGVDLWGIPVMANARVAIPIWILELYGGLGLGGIWYDVEVGSADDDGWLWGGNAFLGADFTFANKLALGLEAKYYLTEDTDAGDEPLDAFAILLVFGWRH